MKRIMSRLKDEEFEEHLDEMQLAAFSDGKLNDTQKEEVFKHLSKCKRCRDVLKIANEMKNIEKKKKINKMKPINNVSYFRAFMPLAAGVVIFLAVPMLDTPYSHPEQKAIDVEKNIFEQSIEYWEKLFDRYFKDK